MPPSGHRDTAKDRTPAARAAALTAAACLLLLACPAPAQERYNRSLAEVEPPEVTLLDAGGAPVSLRAELARRDPLLLQFVFTTCSTVCPVLSATFAAVQQRLPAARLLSISIDPEEDTPARLTAYARRFRAGPRWRFLTGRTADVAAVERAFDANRSDKMRHLPLIFLHTGPGTTWVRLEGFPTAAELAQECRRLLPR